MAMGGGSTVAAGCSKMLGLGRMNEGEAKRGATLVVQEGIDVFL
jgi:hypothetical protein